MNWFPFRLKQAEVESRIREDVLEVHKKQKSFGKVELKKVKTGRDESRDRRNMMVQVPHKCKLTIILCDVAESRLKNCRA